jgi:hypothetical protein
MYRFRAGPVSQHLERCRVRGVYSSVGRVPIRLRSLLPPTRGSLLR